VGSSARAPDGLPDIFHAAGQGIVAGASALLVDFHPHPERALCDGAQALTLDMLGPLVEHVQRVRAAYEASVAAIASGSQPAQASA
jgi:3-deoxy-7-phosphoheptulonate synthase